MFTGFLCFATRQLRNMRIASAFLCTCDGSSTLEAAVCLPMLLLFILGTAQVGLSMWGSMMLTNVIQEAAQQSAPVCAGQNTTTAGQCTTGSQITFAGYVSTVIQQRSLGLINPNQICFESMLLSTAETAVGPNNTDPATISSIIFQTGLASGGNLGQSNDAIVFATSYQWPIFVPYLNQFFGLSQTFTNISMVRNDNMVLGADYTQYARTYNLANCR